MKEKTIGQGLLNTWKKGTPLENQLYKLYNAKIDKETKYINYISYCYSEEPSELITRILHKIGEADKQLGDKSFYKEIDKITNSTIEFKNNKIFSIVSLEILEEIKRLRN